MVRRLSDECEGDAQRHLLDTLKALADKLSPAKAKEFATKLVVAMLARNLAMAWASPTHRFGIHYDDLHCI